MITANGIGFTTTSTLVIQNSEKLLLLLEIRKLVDNPAGYACLKSTASQCHDNDMTDRRICEGIVCPSFIWYGVSQFATVNTSLQVPNPENSRKSLADKDDLSLRIEIKLSMCTIIGRME